MNPTFTGHDVIDQHGDKVGTISDVFYEDGSDEPKWLIVDPGVLRKERLVPVEGAYETDDGKILIPFDKKWIKEAPIVDGNHLPDEQVRRQAAQHFDVDR